MKEKRIEAESMPTGKELGVDFYVLNWSAGD